MAKDARQIANWLIHRAQKDGSGIKLSEILKLSYIAHGWSLEMLDRPLFSNRIEAWQFGPVIRDVFFAFQDQDWRNNMKPIEISTPELSHEDKNLLEQVWSVYGKMPNHTLANLTHVENGPWDITVKKKGYHAPISNTLIKKYYIDQRQKINEDVELSTTS